MSIALAEREVMTEQLADAQPAVSINVVKITNPLWVGALSKVLLDFCSKIKVPSISYETLYAYFCNTVQFGGERAEFWVAFNGQEAMAFAHFYAKGLPHRGIVSCDFNLDNTEGIRLNEIQQSLFKNDDTLDTILRINVKSKLVTNGIIKVDKVKFLGKNTYISKYNKRSYFGKCSTCSCL